MEEQIGWVVCGRWIRRERAGIRRSRRRWWALVMVALVFVIIVDFDG